MKNMLGYSRRIPPLIKMRGILLDDHEELDLKKETSIVITGLVKPEQLRDYMKNGGVSCAPSTSVKRATGNY